MPANVHVSSPRNGLYVPLAMGAENVVARDLIARRRYMYTRLDFGKSEGSAEVANRDIHVHGPASRIKIYLQSWKKEFRINAFEINLRLFIY